MSEVFFYVYEVLKMVSAPWLRYKTPIGKKLCLKLLDLNVYCEKLDCDKLAEELNCSLEGRTLKIPLSDSKLIDYIKSLNEYEKKKGRPLDNHEKSRKISLALLRDKNAAEFTLLDTEKLQGDVLTDTELYIECMKQTIKAVSDKFYTDYPDKIKKHPSTWFRFLCNTIKKNSPKISNDDYEKISRLWDLYADLCISVGINRTLENFQIFSGLGYNTIDKLKEGQNPACADLCKKIYSDCRNDLVGGLSSSFGSSPNQMFIAKSVYGLSENTIVTHVSATEIKKSADDIPLFLDDKHKN